MKGTARRNAPLRWAGPAIAGVAALVVGVLSAPTPPSLARDTSGDPALIAAAEPLLAAWPGALHHVSIAYIDDGEVTVANFGAGSSTEYEIGSLTKTVTASLLADSVERGEVRYDTTLRETLGLSGRLGEVTLEELATHSSGLPNLPSSAGLDLMGITAAITATDAYRFTTEELLDQAEGTAVGAEEFEYSNLGYALLGQALARAAHSEYDDLVLERFIRPLELGSTSLPISQDRIRPGSPRGYQTTGRPSGPWSMTAYAPAGGARSNLHDMTAYLRALLDGTVPGEEALEPRADAGDLQRIGLAWFTTDGLTWHNGITGGFSSFIGMDRTGERGIVVLSDVAGGIEGIGIQLMEELR